MVDVFSVAREEFELGSVLNAYSTRLGMPSLSLSPSVSFKLLEVFHISKLDDPAESGNPGFPPLMALDLQLLEESGLLPVRMSDGPSPSALIGHGS